MKKTVTIIFYILSALAVLSCVTEESLLENRLFYSTDNLRTEVRVATDEGVTQMEKEVSVAIASPIEENLHVSFEKSPQLLETYRTAYNSPQAVLLPSECHRLENMEAVIKAGAVQSIPVKVLFTNLETLDLSDSKEYVLPITLKTDGIKVLESAKTMYFVIKEAFLVNMACDISSNRAWPVWDNFDKVKNMETFTLEALVYNHAFDNGLVKDGEDTWDSSGINTIMGVEDHFLVRIGDSAIPANHLQIACAYKDETGNTTYRKSVTSSAMQLQKNRWYHIAVTFDKGLVEVYIDGSLKASDDMTDIGYTTDQDGNLQPVQFKAVNFGAPHSEEDDGKPRCFWIGYSYQSARYLDGMIAEARVWDRVLTEDELNAPGHFYKLYAEDIDEHLLAYWKFDDGQGEIVKDHSLYGYDLTLQREPLWQAVELK